jgi:hypothetical protein
MREFTGPPSASVGSSVLATAVDLARTESPDWHRAVSPIAADDTNRS